MDVQIFDHDGRDNSILYRFARAGQQKAIAADDFSRFRRAQMFEASFSTESADHSRPHRHGASLQSTRRKEPPDCAIQRVRGHCADDLGRNFAGKRNHWCQVSCIPSIMDGRHSCLFLAMAQSGFIRITYCASRNMVCIVHCGRGNDDTARLSSSHEMR